MLNLQPQQPKHAPATLESIAGKSALSELIEKERGTIAETREERELSPKHQAKIFSVLKARFKSKPEHYKRLEDVSFSEVRAALEANPDLIYSLYKMHQTGGQPDIIAVEPDAFIFGDCSVESPNERRNLTYDEAVEMAKEFGVDIMSEETYWEMQKTGEFDIETLSWLKTPAEMRKAGDARYGNRFEYTEDPSYRGSWWLHNSTDSHYRHKGWRGVLRVPRLSK